MNATRLRNLCLSIAALALVASAARVDAFPSYDNGSGSGCVSCHPAYFDDPSNPTPFGSLHVGHLTKFGITSCGLCHQNPAGGDVPVLTYWSADGFGCAGCHGQDYGDVIPAGLVHAGEPKATAYGLRRKHALIFEALAQPDVCSTCHDPAPGAIFPETTAPPYYGRATTNLTNPCDSSQESFEGAFPGLDNDGNGFADMDDSACGAFVTTTTTTSTTTTTTFPGTARLITVHPGQSIHDAVNAVMPGGKVYIMPGEYQEMHLGENAVTISKNGIRLIAKSKPNQGVKVILKPFGAQRNGIVVQPAVTGTRIDGFRLKGITVQGFPNNGIVTRFVDNFRIEKNESIGNLENGIWPTLSANGLVKKNVSYGSEDAALWVEASENVRVLNNEVSFSPTGLEITVSNNILVKGNEIHHNTAGMGLYHAKGAGIPPLQPPDRNGDWDIIGNYIHDNNEPNSAPPGSLSASLPPGIGIALIGVDRVNVRRNRIENNDSFGLTIAQWCLVAGGCNDTDPPAPGFPDTWPDGNTIVSNDFIHNGTNGHGDFAALAADITYVVVDPTAPDPTHGNCFAGNTPSTLTFVKLGTPIEAKSCD